MKYSFAKRLKAARLAAGLTQLELDTKCRHKVGWVAQYEATGRLPGLESIRTLMKVLEVDANYLLN